MWKPKLWQRIIFAWLAWQVYFSELYFVGAQAGIGYKFNQLLWWLFGVPEDLYGFRNMVLHRIVIFAAISAPPTLFGLLVYQRLGMKPAQFQLRELFVITAMFGVPLAFIRNDPASLDSFGELRAALFAAMLVLITVYLYCTLQRGERDADES